MTYLEKAHKIGSSELFSSIQTSYALLSDKQVYEEILRLRKLNKIENEKYL